MKLTKREKWLMKKAWDTSEEIEHHIYYFDTWLNEDASGGFFTEYNVENMLASTAPDPLVKKVDKELPPLKLRVLIYDKDGFGWVSGRLSSAGNWYLEGELDKNANITHWQYLPKEISE